MPQRKQQNTVESSNRKKSFRQKKGRVRPRSEIGLGSKLFKRLDRQAEECDRDPGLSFVSSHFNFYELMFNTLPDPLRRGTHRLCNLSDRRKWLVVIPQDEIPRTLQEEYSSREFQSYDEFERYVKNKYYLSGWTLDSSLIQNLKPPLMIASSLCKGSNDIDSLDVIIDLVYNKENIENQSLIINSESFLN